MQNYSSDEDKENFMRLWKEINNAIVIQKENFHPSINQKFSRSKSEDARLNCLHTLEEMGFFEDSQIFQDHLNSESVLYNAFSIAGNVIHSGEFYEYGNEEVDFWSNKCSKLNFVIKFTIEDRNYIWSISDHYIMRKCISEHAKLNIDATDQSTLLTHNQGNYYPLQKLISYKFNSIHYINTHHDSYIRQRCKLHFK